MTYDQSVLYLLSLGRELASPRQAQTAKFGLENITALAGRLGHPERSYRSVHIAGTNGKGSTAAMLASILYAAGLRAGDVRSRFASARRLEDRHELRLP